MSNGQEPAYPQAESVTIDAQSFAKLSGGLTKRELFAAMAMQGFCAHPDTMGTTAASIAAMAVEQADALLAALEAR